MRKEIDFELIGIGKVRGVDVCPVVRGHCSKGAQRSVLKDSLQATPDSVLRKCFDLDESPPDVGRVDVDEPHSFTLEPYKYRSRSTETW